MRRSRSYCDYFPNPSLSGRIGWPMQNPSAVKYRICQRLQWLSKESYGFWSSSSNFEMEVCTYVQPPASTLSASGLQFNSCNHRILGVQLPKEWVQKINNRNFQQCNNSQQKVKSIILSFHPTNCQEILSPCTKRWWMYTSSVSV